VVPWWHATGALAEGSAAPRMTGLLEELQSALPRSALPWLASALWVSRQGRHAEAMDLLAHARAQSDDADRLPAGVVCEILARALGTAATAARAAADPGPDAGSGADEAPARYWRALAAGDRAQAEELAARLFEDRPAEPFWGLGTGLSIRSRAPLTRRRAGVQGGRAAAGAEEAGSSRHSARRRGLATPALRPVPRRCPGSGHTRQIDPFRRARALTSGPARTLP
jgi:hypothetical protein